MRKGEEGRFLCIPERKGSYHFFKKGSENRVLRAMNLGLPYLNSREARSGKSGKKKGTNPRMVWEKGKECEREMPG